MTIAESIEKRARQLCDVAERIWEYAEIAFEEKKSAQLLCDVLEKEKDFMWLEKLVGSRRHSWRSMVPEAP